MDDPTVYLTPECVIVYPALFEPSSYGKEDPTYSATFLISKVEDITTLKDVMRNAAYSRFGTQVQLRSLRYPLRDGTIEKATDENGNVDKDNFYYDRWFLRAKSKWQPPIVNIFNDPITNESDLYGGCIVRAYLSFYGYDYMGKKGIGCGLRAVCKVEDGEPLGGGRINTADVFNGIIQEKDTFLNSEPFNNGNDYEPPQEPVLEPDDIPF